MGDPERPNFKLSGGSLRDFLVEQVTTLTALKIVCAFGAAPDRAFTIPDLLGQMPALDWYDVTGEVARLVRLNILVARAEKGRSLYELLPEQPTTELIGRLAVMCDCLQGRFLVLPFLAGSGRSSHGTASQP
jgi:hypothetical protein